MVLFDVVCSITVTWYAAASPDKTLLPLLIQERERQGRRGDRENSKTLFYVLWYAKLLQLLSYYYYYYYYYY